MNKYYIGLTGGIGSGKSSVAGFLQAWGATIIDADQISRDATAAGGLAIDAIEKAFGSQVITAERALDRAAMRELVFQDPAAKQALESIIHPLVRQEMQRQAMAAQGAYVVFDIPLLIEGLLRYQGFLNRICVVDCEEDTQIQRVTQRSGLSPEMVRQIMQNQASRAQRLAHADDVIHNGAQTTLENLQQQCQQLHNQWLALAAQQEGQSV